MRQGCMYSRTRGQTDRRLSGKPIGKERRLAGGWGDRWGGGQGPGADRVGAFARRQPGFQDMLQLWSGLAPTRVGELVSPPAPDSGVGAKWIKPEGGPVPKVRPRVSISQGYLGVLARVPRRLCLGAQSAPHGSPGLGVSGRPESISSWALREDGGPDVATATGRTRGLSQLSGGSALGTGTQTGPNVSLLAGQGRGVTEAGNPCFPDCESAPPHPAPGLRAFKPLASQNSLHTLLTAGWRASSARMPSAAGGAQGSHRSDRGRRGVPTQGRAQRYRSIWAPREMLHGRASPEAPAGPNLESLGVSRVGGGHRVSR